MERLPGGNLPNGGGMPMPGMPPKGMNGAAGRGRGQRGVGAQGKGQGIGLGGAALPGPGGRQLAARVSSGSITQEQAQKTMQQRQTLQKAFGKDWRTQVFGDTGYVQRTRKGLAKNPQSPMVAALNKKLMERRQSMLTVARKKNAGE